MDGRTKGQLERSPAASNRWALGAEAMHMDLLAPAPAGALGDDVHSQVLRGPRRGDKDLQDRGAGRGGKGSVHACHRQTSGGGRAKLSGGHPGI